MESEEQLPECCGNGCNPCVLDIYNKIMEEADKPNKQKYDKNLRIDLLSEIYFKPFTLIEKNQLTCNVFQFRFMAGLMNEEVHGNLPYNIGQHLFLKCPSEMNEQLKKNDTKSLDTDQGVNKGKAKLSEANITKLYKEPLIMRAYTPITIAQREKNCSFDCFVKIYENGIASNYLNKSVVGDVLYWRGPVGLFKYLPNIFTHILMVCMGTGLAPMIPIIETILDNEFDETYIHLKYGVKNMDHVILRERLINMARYWNFSMIYHFSEICDREVNIKFGENVKYEKISHSCLRDYLLHKQFDKLLVLICGNNSFSSKLKTDLQELGVNMTNNVWIF